MSTLRATLGDEAPTPDPGSAVVKSGPAVDALADGTHPLCRVATPDRADARRPRLTEADRVTDPTMLEAAERYAGEATSAREIAEAGNGQHPLLRRSALGT